LNCGFEFFLVSFKHNQWQHTHGWMRISNNFENTYHDEMMDFSMLSNIYIYIYSCIMFEINVLWTLTVEDGCSMCSDSIRLLHVGTENFGFSCECCSKKCVCGISLRLTFVFVDVSMFFKQKEIFFTRFTFYFLRWCKWEYTNSWVNLNSKVELLVRIFLAISFKWKMEM